MLDVLARCWGTDGKAWAGRSVTLYNDPEVTFGKDKVGGIRISHLSHIDGPVTVAIRGRGQGARKIAWPVKPLVVAAPAPVVTLEDVAASTDRAQLRAWWSDHHDLKPAIEARVAEIAALAQGDTAQTGGE